MTRFTYPEVGATRDGGPLPGGYHHLREETVVGSGAADFRAAADALLDWRMHRALGVRIDATAERAAPGVDVTVGLGPVKAPCRVIWTEPVRPATDRSPHDSGGEPRDSGPVHAGWAYGTLTGHPERGEEAFLVTLAPDGQVTLTVTAFSLPGAWYARAAGPLTRLLQRAYARRCGAVLRRLTAGRTSGPSGS